MAGNNRSSLVVQERDLRLFEALETMRVMDREQAKIVTGFGSTTRANARLLALTQAGLLRRFFLGTGGAGRKALYWLSAKGAQFVGVPRRGPRRPQDALIATDFFVEHQLAVNRAYCALKFGPAPTPGVAFQRWIGFYRAIAPDLGLIPDGYVEFTTPAGTVAMFIEVDLGNENLGVWKKKVGLYLQLALSGEYERRFGQSRFRVLVVATSERRLLTIRKVIAGTTDKVFWFASLESVERDGAFGRIWLRPKSDERQPLIQEPR